MEGFSFEGRNSTRSTRQGASRFNAAENKNNVSMMISPVCFSGYYIMSADHLETSYPHESAKGPIHHLLADGECCGCKLVDAGGNDTAQYCGAVFLLYAGKDIESDAARR